MRVSLIEKLRRREAVIGVIGLGYVGLPLVRRYLDVGYKVRGFDVDPAKPAALHAGTRYIEHIDPAPLLAAVREGRLDATTEYGRVAECDAIILCVPTPLTEHREPDLSYVIGSAESVIPHMRPGQVLSLESTTYPGTTDEELLPRLEAAGFAVGTEVFLVYSPEREDPANPNFSTRTIPKVVGGVTAACLEVGVALYGQIIDTVVPVSSARAAEMTKILENTYRAVNIALVNELKLVAERMGVDIFEVIRAAATKPFGFTPFFPGPGLGGHCIPIDPFYLTWKAREYGVNTRFIELAGEVNTAMPTHVVERIAEALNDRGRAVRGARVLVLGVAYKKNVDDMRESPSVVIIEQLLGRGAHVEYADPHVPNIPPMRKHCLEMSATPLNSETLSHFDCVLVATDHDRFDWELIRLHAPLIVDARGRFVADGARIYRA
ncbi:MAG: nucleotide sugar dehydrogenase [Nitrospirota bacterium]|nr:nucleotide sugar dehydrogenase [Nitrospirota bacterium]